MTRLTLRERLMRSCDCPSPWCRLDDILCCQIRWVCYQHERVRRLKP